MATTIFPSMLMALVMACVSPVPSAFAASQWENDPPFERQPFCPEIAEVGEHLYFIDVISPGLGEVRLPAANGCKGSDRYFFQCRFRSPANSGGGEWVPSETSMAPNCQ